MGTRRKFGDKYYLLWEFYNTKARVEKAARGLRNRGYQARFVKSGKDWALYYRTTSMARNVR